MLDRLCRSCGATGTDATFRRSSHELCQTCEGRGHRNGWCERCGFARRRIGAGRGSLGANTGHPTYCPVCPDPGDIEVWLTHGDRERRTNHPPTVTVTGTDETLGARRKRRRSLVLTVNLADFLGCRLRARVTRYRFTHRRCARPRCTTLFRPRNPRHKYCRPHGRSAHADLYQPTYLASLAERAIPCRWCSQTSATAQVFYPGVRECGTCRRRAQRLGRCARCGGPLTRENRQTVRPHCPACDEPPPRGYHHVPIMLTTGTAFRRVWVARNSCRRMFTDFVCEPLVLVDERKFAQGRPGGGTIISGVRAPGVGPKGLLVLECLAAAWRDSAELAALLGDDRAGTGRAAGRLTIGGYAETRFDTASRYQAWRLTAQGAALRRYILQRRRGAVSK